FGLSMAEGLRSVINGELESFELEYPCHGPNKRSWFLAKVRPFTMKGQQYFLTTHQNVTDKVLAEQAKSFQSSLLERVEQAILVCSLSGKIVYWNPYAETLFAYPLEDVIGKSIFDVLVHSKSLNNFSAHSFEQLQQWNQPKEVYYQKKDGGLLPVLQTISPITDADGEIRSVILVLSDISALHQTHQELEAALSEIKELKEQFQAENLLLKETIAAKHKMGEIIINSAAFQRTMSKAMKVAPLDVSVLITGETGTGKELLARAIHQHSKRSHRPLVTINCGAIPKDLVESELFGYVKGAFTGADQDKIGRIELADQATLFLDEIGEMPLDVQVKLLRLLQEGELQRVGSTETKKVDLRIIAATHRDLEEESRKGNFRTDLLFRIKVFPIHLPPLRERREDIPALIKHFAAKFADKHQKEVKFIGQELLDYFLKHPWPGNIRELENEVERAIILAKNKVLHHTDLMELDEKILPLSNWLTLDQMQAHYIRKILADTNWQIEGTGNAAERLGLKPSTLRSKLK
ncbi:MAG: sigma 54-interacting transcriptional regulator, partial [Bacteroidota bacterium]